MPSGAEQLSLEGPVSEAAQLQANWDGCTSQGLLSYMLYNMYSWSIEYFHEKTKELQQIPIYSTEWQTYHHWMKWS